MPIRHIAKLNSDEMEKWFVNHPQCPEEGCTPILEVVLWQMPDNLGIIRTYNFNFALIETQEQYRQMGLAMHELLDRIIKKMAELEIIRPLSEQEERVCKSYITGENLH